eukprot:m51a1_g6463 hypothetical protein (596) ;mRNA; r:29911-32415
MQQQQQQHEAGGEALCTLALAFARIRRALDAREQWLQRKIGGSRPCSLAVPTGLVDSLCWAIDQLGRVDPAQPALPLCPALASSDPGGSSQQQEQAKQREVGAGLLDMLPWALALEVVSVLDVRSRGRLACCSRATRQLLSDPSLWRSLDLVCRPAVDVNRLLLGIARGPQAASLRHLCVRKRDDCGAGALPKERISASTFMANTFDMIPLLGTVRGATLEDLSLGMGSAADHFLEFMATRGAPLRSLRSLCCVRKPDTIQRLIAWSVEHGEPFLPAVRSVVISGTASAAPAHLAGFGALFPKLQTIRTRSKDVAVAAVLCCPDLRSVDETLGSAELRAVTERFRGSVLELEQVAVRATDDVGLLARFLSLCPRLRQLTVFSTTGLCVHALQRSLHAACRLRDLRFFSHPPFRCSAACGAPDAPLPLPLARLETYAGALAEVLPSVRACGLRSVCITSCLTTRGDKDALRADLEALARLPQLRALSVNAQGLTAELCAALLPRIPGLASLSCVLDDDQAVAAFGDPAFLEFASGLAVLSARFSLQEPCSASWSLKGLLESLPAHGLAVSTALREPRILVVEKGNRGRLLSPEASA